MAGQYGNRTGRRASAPSMTGGSEYASMYMYGSLWAVAKKLPPNDRVECVENTPQKLQDGALSDEDVMELIRMHKKGMSFAELAEYSGKGEKWLRNICHGINRGHLLRMVEEGHSDYRMGWRHKK